MDLGKNCLLCRAPVENFLNDEPFDNWLEDVAVSLCQILGLERSCQYLLQNAVYCDACLCTIRDIEFTLKNIQSLQQRLENYRLRVSSLLEGNYDEVGSDERTLGIDEEGNSASYEYVVASIWTALSTEKKPDLTELNRSSGSAVRSSSRIPSRRRRKIVPSESLNVSDDGDSDFYPDVEPITKLETDIPIPRKRNRKNPTPMKVPKKSSAQRKNTPKARQNISKELESNSAKRKFWSSEDVLKRVKLKKQGDMTEDSNPDEKSGDEDQPSIKKRRRTNQGKGKSRNNPPSATKNYKCAKKFNCSFENCKFRCDDERRFQIHCRVHEGDEKPYHCELCKEAKFATNPARFYHQKFNCPANPDRFKQKYAIRTPKSIEVGRRPRVRVDSETGEDNSEDEMQTQNAEEFKCTYEGCAFSTRAERRYQCHIRVHEGDPLPYWCNSCDKKFPKAKHLNLHKHRNCGNVIPCTISGCDSVFPHGPALKAHLNTFHYKEGKLVCRTCSKIFLSSEEEEFKVHEQTHEIRESEGQKFSCIVGDCVSIFTNSVDLRDHVLLEHETSVSKCEICQSVFAHPTSLKQHMTLKHLPSSNTFKCDQCPFVSKFASGLKVHMNKHSGVKRFVCTESGCGKEFSWPSGLRSHMATHTGERNFKCTFENCTKAFVSCTKLRDHEETHSDRRSYFCDRCAKSFKAKKNLKQHFRYVHNVGYTSVKSARRERQKLAEAGLEHFPGPSTSKNQQSRPRQIRQSNKTHSYDEQESPVDPDMNDDFDLPDRPEREVDVALETGNWTYPHQYGSFPAHLFPNPLFPQMNGSSLYLNN